MSRAIGYALATLFTWAAICSLLAAVYFLFRWFTSPTRRDGLNAYLLWQCVAIICVVAAIGLPHSMSGSDPPIRLPLIWMVMPFTAWAAFASIIAALVCFLSGTLGQGTRRVDKQIPRLRFAPLGMTRALVGLATAILFYSLFKASGDPVHLARGYVP